MAKITSVWIRISDEAGSSLLEVLPLKVENIVGKIKIDSIAFYEKGEDGINRLLKSDLPSDQSFVPER